MFVQLYHVYLWSNLLYNINFWTRFRYSIFRTFSAFFCVIFGIFELFRNLLHIELEKISKYFNSTIPNKAKI